MKRFVTTIAILLSQIWLYGSIGHAQISAKIRAIDTSRFPQITLKTRIVESGNRVPFLLDNDIVLAENGIIQQATIDCPDQSVSIMLLLDKSTSMAFFPNTQIRDPDSVRWRSAKAALMRFVDQMAPQDEAGFITFNRFADLEQDFTSDKTSLKDAIYGVRLGPYTAVWAAVDYAITLLAQRPNRKAIVLLTDGEDNASYFVTLPDVILGAQQNGVKIFTVGLGQDVSRSSLDSLARLTGGEFYFSGTGSDLDEIYEGIIRQLPDDCIIRYETTRFCPDGTVRFIDLSVVAGGSAAATDTFYVAPYRLDNVIVRIPPIVSAPQGGQVAIPVELDRDVSQGTPVQYMVDLQYDPATLDFTGIGREKTIASTGMNSYTIGNGTIHVTGNTPGSAESSRILFTLLFGIRGLKSSVRTDISISAAEIGFDCPLISTAQNGTILIDGLCDRLSAVRKSKLHQNNPNPFNPTTMIRYFTTTGGECLLSVLNSAGQVVSQRRWISTQGEHSVLFDATGLSAGVYYYRMEIGGWSDVKKMIVLK